MQEPTYLTAGEQQGNAGDRPQGHMQVFHHCGCGERGVTRGLTSCKLQGGLKDKLTGGVICFSNYPSEKVIGHL